VDGSVELLHRVTQATVALAAQIPAEHPSAAVLGTARFGTGSVVAPLGLILTVNYVVLGADDVTVMDLAGREHSASLVAQDFLTGIAVLRIEADDIAGLPLGSSQQLACGVDVLTVAAAGRGERRVAAGAVTSLETFDAYWEYRLDRAIWSTCNNPGLAGGPVCDTRGRLVGIASLSLGNLARASLAIPAENFSDHADELIANGGRVTRSRRAWIGMFCYALPDRTVVAGLIPGSPGQIYGLEPGDVVVGVGSHRIRDRADLYERIWDIEPGASLELGVYRDGSLRSLRITTGDAEDFFA
jgi:serine protease Do